MIRLLAATGLFIASAVPASAFSLSFSWGNIPRCTSGNPNTVPNPRFVISDLPAGTETVELRLVDLDVPSYNHGGATLRMSQSGTVQSGLFTYRSPCPPGGVHTYEWRATARAGNRTLGTASARRQYPE